MSLTIRVKRKCDGKVGVVKNANGTYGEGLKYFNVVFDENSKPNKAPVNHFEILSISEDREVLYRQHRACHLEHDESICKNCGQ